MGADRKKLNNNMKFYTFIEIVKKYSDKDVSLSIKEINNHMKNAIGVVLDRRTIYGYIKDMKELGFDVSVYDKERDGYYFNVHELENVEIRILSDAVLTSNFITKQKTIELVDKLQSFASVYHQHDFVSKIFVEEISKSTNEQIFNNITKIDEAIANSKKIRFNYCNYDCYKNLVCRKDEEGKDIVYNTSPVYMILRKKNYYLVCADDNSEILKNYRVDRMVNVELLDEDVIDVKDIYEAKDGFNPGEYLRLTFKMYNGASDFIIVEFDKKLFNYLLDSFGDFIFIAEKGHISNNNLDKGIDLDMLQYQILEKILGSKQYNNMIISGHYMEDEKLKVKIDSFGEKVRELVETGILGEGFGSVSGAGDAKVGGASDGSEIGGDGARAAGGLDVMAEVHVENVDGKLDARETDKRYIGIFKAKKGMGLVKWMLEMGSEAEVIYPESVREAIVEEITKLSRIYL